jgi:hypothetical protein
MSGHNINHGIMWFHLDWQKFSTKKSATATMDVLTVIALATLGNVTQTRI